MITVIDSRAKKVIVSANLSSIDAQYAGTIKIVLESGYSIVIDSSSMEKIIEKVGKSES